MNDIDFLWDVEACERIFSPWLIKYNAFREMYEADEHKLVDNYVIGNIRRFDWAKEQITSSIEIGNGISLKA